MPMPTIPGIPPETWEMLLQIIGQLNTSIVELQEQGITTFEQLRQWLMLQGYELVEISEVVGYTVCKTTAVDPTTSNAVATRVATDIATTGGAGTAVAQFTSGGNRTLGLVTKAVAVGACLSLLVSTIGAGLVSDEVKEDLITSADPFTIDGENVPVLIDENGKTHFLEEMVEAVRAKAIELGVFSEGFEPNYQEYPNGTLINLQQVNVLDALTLMRNHLYQSNITDGWASSVPNADTVLYLLDKAINDIRVNKVYTNQYSEKFTVLSDYTLTGFARMSADSTLYRFTKAPSFTVSSQITYHDINAATGGQLSGISIACMGFDGSTYANGTYLEYGAQGQNRFARVMYVYNGYTLNIPAEVEYNTGEILHTDISDFIIENYIPGANYMTMRGYGKNRRGLVFNGSASDGVEGITPAQDLIAAGIKDTTIPLTQVIPQLDTGQMSIASPTEDDLEHKSNWYPVSINSNDVFTDGATEEETGSAPDGDVKPDVQPDILDAIRDLIEQINPDGTPDVPVSDSGDTPPENPPLTPSSGANGSNGLWAIYNPTLAQVQQFGAWLWSDSLADQFKRIFNSPIDGVIGFHMLYCTPSRGADQTIKCGFLESPVSSRTVASPYVEIDCGTVNIGEYYRNALDYDYTRISVYLPFIGIVPLDTNIVMGSSLNITYRVDVLTGTCLAQIKVIKENSDAVMYAFEGNCAVQIPLTATTYTGMIGALMSGVSAGIGVMTGNIAQAAASGVNALANMYSGKSGVKQSGTMGANAGALGIRKPYVIITHPVAYMPVNFNKLEGLPSNITATLGTLTGFTRVRSVHLENIGTATQEEINMIEELLKKGVII